MLNCWWKLNSWLDGKSSILGAWSSALQIVVFPLVLITAILTYFQVKEYVQRADLVLEFSSPAQIAYTIVNNSKTTADNPAVGFGLFDLDVSPVSAVPIVCREFSYLRGGNAQGPNALIGNHGKAGHRYFGFAYVLAKNSERERWYWIFFVHGEKDGAWCVQLDDDEPKLWNPIALMQNPEDYIRRYMPEEKRVPIR